MTLNKFIKELQKLQSKGFGKAHVSIMTREVSEKRNSDYSHQNVEKINTTCITYCVDDCPYLADGSERLRTVVELSI